MLPSFDDPDKLIHVGKMTLLRKARRDAVLKLRDTMVPLFNSMDSGRVQWSTEEIRGLLNEVDEINRAIEAMN